MLNIGTLQTERRARFKQWTCHSWKTLAVIQVGIKPEMKFLETKLN
jgi:hypothetical protein